MKELIDLIWNAPLWAVLCVCGAFCLLVASWFIYLFFAFRKRGKRFDEMNQDFKTARRRVRRNLNK